MKKLALVIAAMVSTSAFAASTHLETKAFTTQEQAFDAGFELAEQIGQMDQNKLAHTLNVGGTADYGSVAVNDIEVKVETFAKQKGELQYRAVLDVDFDYDW